MFVRILLSITLLFFSITTNFAQNLEIGGGLGGTNTRTDVSNFNFLNTSYALNAFARWNFTYAWVVRLDYKYMDVKAADRNNSTPLSKVRKYEFQTSLQQLSINVEYNFLDFRSVYKKTKISPYITIGVGVNKLKDLEDSYGKNINNYNFCIPFGLGIKYALTKNLNIGSNFETTKTFTDNLDNLNQNGPVSIPQHLRGLDFATNDWYYYLGFNLSYTFYSINCPEFYDF